ncbi:iron-containing alcohol dehydrogenase [Pseudomonas japonica]|uniref:Alcohol dehydrogenase, class IV n=1 Tax=Pseudomonas japonica TaxID=256466 RepID=A0A239A935_9PSED|nr:iron-containing alcohol dehydrogenase [Pseudomonas japonica]SNR92127.1 Alcohol dehydrogenase, class IV [Pseudomonas japonica]
MSTGYFEFWARTRVHCAVGATVRLPALLVSLGAKRVLLLSDKGLEKIGLVEQVAYVLRDAAAGNQLQLAGIFTDILPDAGSNSVNAATRYAREIGADAIVALGGGSAMDVAKAVKFALAHDLVDICDVLAAGMRMEVTGQPMGIAHISIPTTAGTGSEMTNGAVVFNDNTGVKAVLQAPYLESDIALLDAQLTLGLPTAITADTGMDALTHAVEALVNATSNPFTDGLALSAVDRILGALPIAVQDGHNLQARQDMLQAASMACLALANALSAAPVHNCSHALGALYHIPHGRANGVLLPVVMEELIEFYLPYASQLAKAFSIPDGEPEATVRKVISRIRHLQQQIGMPADFAQFRIPTSDMERIVKAVASDPLALLYPIPPQKIAAIASRLIGTY